MAGAQQCAAPDVQRQVAVAQREPVGRPELAQPGHALQRVAGDAPALRSVDQAGQRAGDNIEVGRNIQPVQLEVVAGVDDRGHILGRGDLHQAFEKARGADTAR